MTITTMILNSKNHALLCGNNTKTKRMLISNLVKEASHNNIPSLVFDSTGRLLSYADPFTDPIIFWDMENKNGLPFCLSVDSLDPELSGSLFHLPLPQKQALALLLKEVKNKNIPLSTMDDLICLCDEAVNNYDTLPALNQTTAKASLVALKRRLNSLKDRDLSCLFYPLPLAHEDLLVMDEKGRTPIHTVDFRLLLSDRVYHKNILTYHLKKLEEGLDDFPLKNGASFLVILDEADHLLDAMNKEETLAFIRLLRSLKDKGAICLLLCENIAGLSDEFLQILPLKLMTSPGDYPYDDKTMKKAVKFFPPFSSAPLSKELAVKKADTLYYNSLDTKGNFTSLLECIHTGQGEIILSDSEKRKLADRSFLYEYYLYEPVEKTASYLTENETEAEKNPKRAKTKDELKKEKHNKRVMRYSASTVVQAAAGTAGRELGKSLSKNANSDFTKRMTSNICGAMGRSIVRALFRIEL